MKSTIVWLLAIFASNIGAAELTPFTARYAVYLDGKQQGESTLALARIDATHWHYTLRAEATRGLARIAGAATEQLSELEQTDNGLRLLHSSQRTETLLSDRHIEAVFDWDKNEARWRGDIKTDRQGPVPLAANSSNGHALTLLLALAVTNAPADGMLRYQLVERGRARDVEYRIEPAVEIDTALGRRHAIPLSTVQTDKDRATTAWYDPALPPTPLRLLQTEGGRPKYELRLLELQIE